MNDINNAAFVYSANMLRMLLSMKLITQEEYERIIAISKAYYESKIYCV